MTYLCEYGCGQEAKHQFKNGKWCCNNNIAKCPYYKSIFSKKLKGKKKSIDHRKNISSSHKGKTPWNKNKKGVQQAWNKGLTKKDDKRVLSYSLKKRDFSQSTKKKISISLKGNTPWNKGKTGIYSKETLKKISIKQKPSIKQLYKKHPTFAKVEEMRYEPGKEKVIQVHCKNHNCPNSKEQGGWFTPTKTQLYERIRYIDRDGAYFYCSVKCKEECPLYYFNGNDPFKIQKQYYTASEIQIFRQYVLERDDYICEYCGKKATDVHHSRPQKLEPGFALDPDFGVACCEECHYKYGHKDECSTGNLANKICV